MEKVNLPEMQKGIWKVEHFTVDNTDFHSLLRGRAVPLGRTFTKLTRNGKLIMSDTPAEMSDHWEAVRMARGSCLLNGLGLGMVLKNILLKPTVTSVIVVEISQDLIDLISPFYIDPRVTFVCADAFEYKSENGKRFQMVWHDIWDDICTDNLADMKKLHNKYARKTDWQGSWSRDICLAYEGRQYEI
jgi:hypothetical protein